MKYFKIAGYAITTVTVLVFVWVLIARERTEQHIHALQQRIVDISRAAPAPELQPSVIAALPDPVQRYFTFAFPEQVPTHSLVRLTAAGEFRRPLTDTFNPTTAEQVIAIGTPALMFSATTPVIPGIWARAYDYFAQGEMEMKAMILSTLTVMDQQGTAELNRISLRRWLLESALFPQALLPGGPVSWQAIDEHSALAVAQMDGVRATMIAYFDEQGRMTHMSADEEGDLSTPYHGSGEYVQRGDYQRIGQQMIPMSFTIARAANGNRYPFWEGRITSIAFE